MPLSFDPYYKWLAIPRQDQPPNHYRLLGVPLFTEDREVLAHAATQRTMFLETFLDGEHAESSAQMLDEVAVARTCLLSLFEKAAYDAQLRRELANGPSENGPALSALAAVSPPAAGPHERVPSLSQLPAFPEGEAFDVKARIRAGGARPRRGLLVELMKIVAGGAAGLVLGYTLTCWLAPRADFLGLFGDGRRRQLLDDAQPRGPRELPAATIAEAASRDAATLLAPSPPVESFPTGPLLPPVESVESVESLDATPGASNGPLLARLIEQRDQAVARRHLADAMRAVEEIAAMTDGDSLAARLQLLATLSATATLAPDLRDAAAGMLDLVEQARRDGRRELAARYADLALVAAQRSSDPELVRQATLQSLQVRRQP